MSENHHQSPTSNQFHFALGQLLPSDTMILYCCVSGDKQPFPIEISREQAIDKLKNAIIAKRPLSFRIVGTVSLKLWKEVIPSQQKKQLKLSDQDDDDALDAVWKFGDCFQDPPSGSIHIVINAPPGK